MKAAELATTAGADFGFAAGFQHTEQVVTRRLCAMLAVGAATMSLLACSGTDAVSTSVNAKDAVASQGASNYTFNGVTALGSLIPISDRRVAGDAKGQLLSGSAFDLNSTTGNVTLVNLYASWCPPCQIETPQLAEFYPQMKAKGVDFIGVATKETSTSAAESFVSDEGVSYPVVYDDMARFPVQIGKIRLIGLPMTILLDKHHRVAAVYSGKVLPPDLQPVLTQLLAET